MQGLVELPGVAVRPFGRTAPPRLPGSDAGVQPCCMETPRGQDANYPGLGSLHTPANPRLSEHLLQNLVCQDALLVSLSHGTLELVGACR